MGSFGSLNTSMNKPKQYTTLLSFISIRRGDWVLKVSVFDSSYVLIVAKHYYTDEIQIRQFVGHSKAADFIDYIVSKDTDDSKSV